jgi:hypothetical protein
MTLGRVVALVSIAIGVMVVNVGLTVLYMVVYSHVVNPGHAKADYEAHVKIAAPYCSIVAGIPLMFLVGWWLGNAWDARVAWQSTLIVWVAYAAVDLAIVIGSGLTLRIGVLSAVSLLTKLAAAFGGVLAASGRPG